MQHRRSDWRSKQKELMKALELDVQEGARRRSQLAVLRIARGSDWYSATLKTGEACTAQDAKVYLPHGLSVNRSWQCYCCCCGERMKPFCSFATNWLDCGP